MSLMSRPERRTQVGLSGADDPVLRSPVAAFARGTTVLRIARPLLVLFVLGAVAGYAYRFELQGVAQHVLGALMPYRGEQVGAGSVRFEAWPDGEFRIDALVNGAPVTFIVDTGASEVVLTPRDAERLGYDLNDLDFSNVSMTANGPVGGAPIVLSEIAIGPIRMDDVAAAVNGAPMVYSLLGINFLNRLKSYEEQDGMLTLTQ
jgi:aspartyl protease family protein